MALFATRLRENHAALTAAATVEADDPLGAGLRLTPDGTVYVDELFVDRAMADSVPAYRRAKRIISSTLSTLTFRQWQATSGRPMPMTPFLRQPDPTRVASAVLADLYDDLIDYSVSYWLNPNWNSADGWLYNDASNIKRKHKSIRHLAHSDVLEVRDDSYVILRGGREEIVPAWGIVGFECKAGGWLKAGARAIITLRLLEDAARNYATNPSPTVMLRNTGPRKTAEQVTETINNWITAVRNKSVAYLGRDLAAEAFSFDAEQIALEASRKMAVLDIARLSGVPSLYLFQGPNDASMTYSNMTQQRLDLHAAMLPFATAVEQRLSFDDITGQGSRVSIDFTPWLRADPELRARLAQIYVPLGVMSVEQAQQFEEITPMGAPE